MKTNRRGIATQRQLLDQRLEHWASVKDTAMPPAGWIKAVRGALGMNTRQLAALLGTTHSTIVALEKREAEGKASLEMVQRAARAMGCKLIYAIVPIDPGKTLDGMVNERARARASAMLARVEHSMRLEKQGSELGNQAQIERLAAELKQKMDPTLWGTEKLPKKKAPR
jgi:predicted DNA-binding mobile mystery protein A